VESLLVGLILDGNLDGKIDRVTGVLLKKAERGTADNSAHAASNAAAVVKPVSETAQKCDAMDQLIQHLENFSAQVTSTRVKDTSMSMRGLVH
jgi:hypothetical protein